MINLGHFYHKCVVVGSNLSQMLNFLWWLNLFFFQLPGTSRGRTPAASSAAQLLATCPSSSPSSLPRPPPSSFNAPACSRMTRMSLHLHPPPLPLHVHKSAYHKPRCSTASRDFLHKNHTFIWENSNWRTLFKLEGQTEKFQTKELNLNLKDRQLCVKLFPDWTLLSYFVHI